MSNYGEFTGEKWFRIHRNDAGTEAHRAEYVKWLEADIDRLRKLVQCCERDHNFDGNCDRHPDGLRGEVARLQLNRTRYWTKGWRQTSFD